MSIERGIVKFYNPEKKFGFVTVLSEDGTPTREELFFHHNNGWFQGAGADAPEFLYETGTLIAGKVKRIRALEKGDQLVFVRGRNAKGEKVSKWGMAETYDKIVVHIANRPVYRVTKYSTYYGKSEETVLFEGNDVQALSVACPKWLDYGKERDELSDGSADGGDMYWHIAIERQLGDGTWEYDDPRVFVCCLPRDLQREAIGYNTRYDRNCVHH